MENENKIMKISRKINSSFDKNKSLHLVLDMTNEMPCQYDRGGAASSPVTLAVILSSDFPSIFLLRYYLVEFVFDLCLWNGRIGDTQL